MSILGIQVMLRKIFSCIIVWLGFQLWFDFLWINPKISHQLGGTTPCIDCLDCAYLIYCKIVLCSTPIRVSAPFALAPHVPSDSSDLECPICFTVQLLCPHNNCYHIDIIPWIMNPWQVWWIELRVLSEWIKPRSSGSEVHSDSGINIWIVLTSCMACINKIVLNGNEISFIITVYLAVKRMNEFSFKIIYSCSLFRLTPLSIQQFVVNKIYAQVRMCN